MRKPDAPCSLEWERERDSTWQAISARHPEIPAYVVTMIGTGHFSFSDAPFVMPSLLRGTGASMAAMAAYTQIVQYLRDFFDHHLLGDRLRILRAGQTDVPG